MATILVVDDTVCGREPVVRLLRLDGHHPLAADNGCEALKVLQHFDVDLVLLDLMMPEMDGVTFLKHLRADARLADTPVILLTALRYGDAVNTARDLGVDAIMLKSQFTFEELSEEVGRSLVGHSGGNSTDHWSAPTV